MATDAAEWPSRLSVPRATKDLLNRFYKLADTNSDDVGREYAETIFTSDGSMLVNKRKFQGKQEILHSRDGSWNNITHRRHEVFKVYACTEAADDLLLLGKCTWGFSDGKSAWSDFAARAIIDTYSPKQHQFKLYQGWADLQPMVEGLECARKA